MLRRSKVVLKRGARLTACLAGVAMLASTPSCADEPTNPQDPGAPLSEANPDGEPAPADHTNIAKKTLPYRSNEVLVRFKAGTDLALQYATLDNQSATMRKAFRSPSNLRLLELAPGTDVQEAISKFRKNPNVLYAEPNYIYHTHVTPDDPRFAEQWALDNTGQTGGTADADINGPEGWDVLTGSATTVIGVLDTGVDYLHEDLAPNIFVNPGEIPANGVDDDGNGFIDDIHGVNTIAGTGDPMDDVGHGTHVNGTIGAVGNNGIGVTGVNWNATMVSCKAFDSTGGSLDAILQCMDYFLELKTRADNPVNIIATNNSWGGGGFSQALVDAIDAHRQAGMLFIAAAGNSGLNTDNTAHFPSSYELPNIISVLASDHNDERAVFSNFGRASVDIAAPGVNVLSTVPGDQYDLKSGTSMATPHVVGLIGLLKSQDPSRDWRALKNLVLSGGKPIEGAENLTLTGRRIQAFGEDGTGSLNCDGQNLTVRLAPAVDTATVGLGDTVSLGVLSIDCDLPAEVAPTVTVTPGGQEIALVDADETGNFTGEFQASELGRFELAFSTGDVVTLDVLANYGEPTPVDFQFREITGEDLELGDDATGLVVSPFPISFGESDAGLTDVTVGSNGTISFAGGDSPFRNTPLPTAAAQNLVAPFWTDLSPNLSGQVLFEVVGEEPNRELVVEWRDVSHYPGVGGATFQVVFFENSSNILFNYADVQFENANFDGGANATVGVQVAPGKATQFSFNTASLTDESSLLWQIGAPNAVAGDDQVVSPNDAVTLDGSASADPDGTIVSYEWTQLSGEPVTLEGADTPVATFQAPDASGTLTFRLTVVDDAERFDLDEVNVVVNRAPTANAGNDIVAGTNGPAQLDGTGSFDEDGEVVGYRWTQLSGAAVVLTGEETATPSFVAPSTPGNLIFELVVVDEYGYSDRDAMTVTVVPNESPIANAGGDFVVRPGEYVALNGTESSDPDGDPLTFSWEVLTCSTATEVCAVTLNGADTATPSFEAPIESSLVYLQLTVTDELGATSSDTIIVGVFYQAPTALANAPEVVTLGSAVTLDGSASFDPDGVLASYEWVQLGGTPVALTGADGAIATFTAPSATGSLRFQLTVTDDDGQAHRAIVDVLVHRPPVAVATASATVAESGTTVTLDASGSFDAETYAWIQTSGPTSVIQGANTATASFVTPSVSGDFEVQVFELTVTDSLGFRATDTVSVVVVPASSTP